jgi:hypothetical protein
VSDTFFGFRHLFWFPTHCTSPLFRVICPHWAMIEAFIPLSPLTKRVDSVSNRPIPPVALLILLSTGCGTAPPGPAFFMSNALEKAPPRPIIRIMVPAGPVQAKVYARMDCRVELELPEGGVLPSTVCIQFHCGNRSVSGDILRPLSVHGRLYTFQCTTRVPSQVGTYQGIVIAQYCIKPARLNDEPKSRDVPLQFINFQESGPKVVVKR